MKRPRKDWATRKLPPATVEEYDRYLDALAAVMARSSREEAELGVPLYRRLLADRDRLRNTASLMADAMARARSLQGQRPPGQAPDQTAAQFS